jgi:hypothetical protein
MHHETLVHKIVAGNGLGCFHANLDPFNDVTAPWEPFMNFTELLVLKDCVPRVVSQTSCNLNSDRPYGHTVTASRCFTASSTPSELLVPRTLFYWGHPVAQTVEALRYKPEDRGFNSWWNDILPAALWPCGRLSCYQRWVPGIFRCAREAGLRWPVRTAGNLTTLCADCLQIWEPQPPGNLRACTGIYLYSILPGFSQTSRVTKFWNQTDILYGYNSQNAGTMGYEVYILRIHDHTNKSTSLLRYYRNISQTLLEAAPIRFVPLRFAKPGFLHSIQGFKHHSGWVSVAQ